MADQEGERRFLAEVVPTLPGLSKSAGLSKTGTSFSNFGGPQNVGSGAGADFKQLAPQIRNPLLNVVNFYFPQDRKVLNQWLRYYQRFHPVVGSILDLHGEMIVSKFHLAGIKDQKVMQVYEESINRCDVYNRGVEMVKEFFNLGEVFPYLQWNEEEGFFDQLIVINPDYVHMRSHPFVHRPSAVTFEIEPSQALKDFVNSRDPVDQELRRYVDPSILNAVSGNSFIKAHPFNMSGMIRRASPYDVRGTSITLRALKDLLYEDILREAQWQIATAHVRPIWIYKLGDPNKGILPTIDDLKAFREVLLRGTFDPNFAIITSYAFSVENIGSQGKLLPLIPEFEWVHERILMALFSNKLEMMAEGPTYATSSIARVIKNQRYQAYRSMIETWITEKILKPIARAHGFYKAESGNNVQTDRRYKNNNGSRDALSNTSKRDADLLLPTIEWENPLDMSDVDSFRNAILRLATDKNPKVAVPTLLRILGLDPGQEELALKNQEGTVFDPQYQAYREAHVKKKITERLGLPGGMPGAPGAAAPGAAGAAPAGGAAGAAKPEDALKPEPAGGAGGMPGPGGAPPATP